MVQAQLDALDQSLERFMIAYEVHSEVVGQNDDDSPLEGAAAPTSESIPTRIIGILSARPYGLDSAEIAKELGPTTKMTSVVSILSRMRSSGIITKRGRKFFLPDELEQVGSQGIEPPAGPIGGGKVTNFGNN